MLNDAFLSRGAGKTAPTFLFSLLDDHISTRSGQTESRQILSYGPSTVQLFLSGITGKEGWRTVHRNLSRNRHVRSELRGMPKDNGFSPGIQVRYAELYRERHLYQTQKSLFEIPGKPVCCTRRTAVRSGGPSLPVLLLLPGKERVRRPRTFPTNSSTVSWDKSMEKLFQSMDRTETQSVKFSLQ